MKRFIFWAMLPVMTLTFSGLSMATRLVEVLPVDNQCLVLHWQDGMIEYNWDDTTSGSCNGWDYFHTEKWSFCSDKDQYVPYGTALNTAQATQTGSFTLSSEDDDNYGGNGRFPRDIYRKSKVWEASYDQNKPAMFHWIYLELPSAMQRGKTYTLEIHADTESDQTRFAFVFDEFSLESPAIKISNLGYEAGAPHKYADVYLWMGDGGERDFDRLQNTPWFLYDVKSETKAYSGKLKFRMENRPEPLFSKDFTGSDIWECDFSDFTGSGEFRLVIEGIGCSAPFTIGFNRFEEAFKTSMQGMFYQRMGCAAVPAGGFPKARRPLYKQGVEPSGFEARISNINMVTGPNPDDINHYGSDVSGQIAESTWGGWCDAYDNDQRPVNFICVFDILLTYYLNPEVFTDDQLYIPETGNEIPDILDEALWEIDWWLRMRDPDGGYLTGLCNITPPMTVNYAGAACAWQGWCVAAGCAMVADCFRLAGKPSLQLKYTTSAVAAYDWARSQENQMLGVKVGDLRGRDLKMTAAAFLFNLSGTKVYEDVILAESKVTQMFSQIRSLGNWEQQFATIAYILSPQKVNYPALQSNMKSAVIQQAKTNYVENMKTSPTKAVRWTNQWEGMCQTSNEMSIVAMAHRITEKSSEKEYFEKGLYAEAEWTLGRNPLGLVQMTGLTDRCFTQTFAPGRRDGFPGLTPGWTPYMCRDGWMNENHIVRCEWYTSRNYPKDKEIWPWGEHFWNSRYNVPNGESTPQQNFRQKIVLYGSLYALNIKAGEPDGRHTQSNPDDYLLNQNYPNPFNSKTTFSYSLPEATHTELSIYNVSGRKVINLVKADQDKGDYSIDWDGRNQDKHQATSGIYILKMKADEVLKSVKLCYVK